MVFRVVWVVVARDSPISEVIIEVLPMRCTKRLRLGDVVEVGWCDVKGVGIFTCSVYSMGMS